MNVLVCGSQGCVGRAVVRTLRERGHHVVEAARHRVGSASALPLDFMQAREPEAWAGLLAAHRIDAVVNCVGILIESREASFERVHSAGPIELFRGAAIAGVGRVVQVSALGVATGRGEEPSPYLRSKQAADEALLALDIDAAVVRPSLVYGPGSQSASLFATLASMPAIGLPGRGDQRVQPIHVFELAESIAALVEHTGSVHGIYELAGPEPVTYREMLAAYRDALRLGEALWLPTPMVLMRLSARLAEAIPQRVFSRDTIRLLERGSCTTRNAAPVLLGRSPTALAEGLAVTPPKAAVDLRVSLAPLPERALRTALAIVWIHTAAISALLPERSGVLDLLAQCGFTGTAGWIALAGSCALNLSLGLLTLLKPSIRLYALQAVAVIGYTATAAVNAPELTLDHCGPLAKNLAVLGCVLMLWLARASQAGAPSTTPRPMSLPAVRTAGLRLR